MKIYGEFGNPQRRGSAVSPRSSLLPDSVASLSFSQLRVAFPVLSALQCPLSLSVVLGMWPSFVPLGDWGSWERLISPLPFSRITKRSYPSFLYIQVSGIGSSSMIPDIYMLGGSNIILESEQEDICRVICRWFVLLFGIGVLFAFPTTVLSYFYYSKE